VWSSTSKHLIFGIGHLATGPDRSRWAEMPLPEGGG
jgi:hypothetical protein